MTNNYQDNFIEVEGIVVKVKEGLVEIDIKGRLGNFTVPKRMIISEHEIEVGQTVQFKMTFPEVKYDQQSKIDEYRKCNV
ncbi:MAG TPA: CBO2463/CBO2479 domain-containing protein [Clostridia bacterium]|nr:CBO2463/CBO2479 domain-containing protein [Clostridia bacterium]